MLSKILICTKSWPPLQAGGVFRPYKFAKYLKDHGFLPVVLTVKEKIKKGSMDYEMMEEVKDIEVHHVRVSDYFRDMLPGDFKKIIRKFSFQERIPDRYALSHYRMIKAVESLHRKHSFALVFTTSPPHSFALLGKQIKERLHIPWVSDFRDEWSKNVYYKNNKTSEQIEKENHIEEVCMSAADKIITTTSVMRRNIVTLHSKKKEDIVVIPNGFDEDDFTGELNHGVGNDACTIAYNGSLNNLHDPAVFLAAVEELCREDQNIKLRLKFMTNIQGFQKLNKYKELIERKILLHQPFLPHKESLTEIGKADILLLLVTKCERENEFIPGKLFEYLYLNKTILAITLKDGINASVINETGSGYSTSNDKSEIKKLLRDLYQKWENNSLQTQNRGIEAYSRRNLTRQLADVFKSVMIKN